MSPLFAPFCYGVGGLLAYRRSPHGEPGGRKRIAEPARAPRRDLFKTLVNDEGVEEKLLRADQYWRLSMNKF